MDENGKPLVPAAFIPRDEIVKCPKCGWRRTLMVFHCEHCDADAPSIEIETQVSKTDYEIGKSVSDVVQNAVKSILEEIDKMLPPADGDDRQMQRPQRRQEGTMKYLTNENLGKTPKEAKILAVKYDGENRFGPRVVLKLDLDGDVLFWGVNIKKNPNYRSFVERFGRDETDWIGNTIKLYLEKDDFSESYFPRVEFESKKKR